MGKQTAMEEIMSLKQIVITHVTRIIQGETVIYTFPIEPSVLLDIGIVLRFGDHPDGVNRMFTPGHALGISKFMRDDPSPCFMENLCGDMRKGDGKCWVFDENLGTLTGMVETDPDNRIDGCCFVVDDGQHRMAALEMLTGDDRARFQMLVTATMGASVDTRLKLFRMQTKAKRQDRRLQLAIDHKRGTLKYADRVAYDIALKLNSDPSSPLKNRIYFGQDPRVPKDTMNLLGLMSFLKACVGKRSMLHGPTEAAQIKAVFDFLVAAAGQWSSSWGRPEKILGRPVGICTLIRLLSGGGRFHNLLQRDFSHAKFEKVLAFGAGFKWEPRADGNKAVNPNVLAARLDDYLWEHSQPINGADSASA